MGVLRSACLFRFIGSNPCEFSLYFPILNRAAITDNNISAGNNYTMFATCDDKIGSFYIDGVQQRLHANTATASRFASKFTIPLGSVIAIECIDGGSTGV